MVPRQTAVVACYLALSPSAQALFGFGSLVRRGFSALDKQLEEVKLLPKFEASVPEAPDVIDPATGKLKSECQEVRLSLRPTRAHLLMHMWAVRGYRAPMAPMAHMRMSPRH